MKSNFKKFALTAGIVLATAFTFNCSSKDEACEGEVCYKGGSPATGNSSSSIGGGSSSSITGGSIPNTIDGIWKSSAGETMTLNNGNFELSRGIKGTYTAAASNITFNVNELYGDFLNQQDFGFIDVTYEKKWYTQSQAFDVVRNWAEGQPLPDGWLGSVSGYFDDMFPTRTGVINGNAITTEVEAGKSVTYIKTT